MKNKTIKMMINENGKFLKRWKGKEFVWKLL